MDGRKQRSGRYLHLQGGDRADRTAETAKCEKTGAKTAGRRRGDGYERARTGGKERAEGRWSGGAALKRTKSKGREGSRGWMRWKSFCARLHKGTLIWHAITGWAQWKRGRTRRAADSQGQWLCDMNETPYKGCLVQWLLPQTLCCHRLSQMKLQEINCFRWFFFFLKTTN